MRSASEFPKPTKPKTKPTKPKTKPTKPKTKPTKPKTKPTKPKTKPTKPKPIGQYTLTCLVYCFATLATAATLCQCFGRLFMFVTCFIRNATMLGRVSCHWRQWPPWQSSRTPTQLLKGHHRACCGCWWVTDKPDPTWRACGQCRHL